jgi:hypothetical protein
MTESASERRLAENEVVFRQLNQELKDRASHLFDEPENQDYPMRFYCECSDENCRARISLNPELHQKHHANPCRFVILPGHESLAIERVVEKHSDYWVVEKFEVPPAKVMLGGS